MMHLRMFLCTIDSFYVMFSALELTVLCSMHRNCSMLYALENVPMYIIGMLVKRQLVKRERGKTYNYKLQLWNTSPSLQLTILLIKLQILSKFQIIGKIYVITDSINKCAGLVTLHVRWNQSVHQILWNFEWQGNTPSPHF